MNIHEFQAKQILQKYGIPIPEFFVVNSLEQVQKLIEVYQLEKGIIKVQVHAGGRGKAGGVKFARNREEVIQFAKELLGKKIINIQTGPEGLVSRQVLITHPIDFIKEYYLSVVMDRQKAQAMLIASPAGGVEIEQVAEQNPEKVLVLPLPFEGKLLAYHWLRINKFMGWQGGAAKQGTEIINALIQAFVATDATLIEINPLVETADQKLWALDAKFLIDDNALFRQPEIKQFFDPTQVLPQEARAQQEELAYIALEGNIGCMVNGAGLAMATMDIIQYYGGKPANFLDVGGGASKEKIAEGFKILLSDPKVQAVLVNIFGGIMNCETLAEGILAAANELHIHVPVVVRMEGTNVIAGKKLLQESGLNVMVANDLTEAAQKAVAEAKKGRS